MQNSVKLELSKWVGYGSLPQIKPKFMYSTLMQRNRAVAAAGQRHVDLTQQTWLKLQQPVELDHVAAAQLG